MQHMLLKTNNLKHYYQFLNRINKTVLRSCCLQIGLQNFLRQNQQKDLIILMISSF